MNIKKIQISKEFLQKVGWAILISVIIGTLVMMVVVISNTEPNIQAPQQSSDDSDAGLLNELNAALGSTKIATLESKRGIDEYAIASRTIENGSIRFEIAMESIPPEDGKFYEVWLIGDENISLGSLLEDDSEFGLYVLSFSGDQTLSEYNKLVISHETLLKKSNGMLETIILEGIFE